MIIIETKHIKLRINLQKLSAKKKEAYAHEDYKAINTIQQKIDRVYASWKKIDDEINTQLTQKLANQLF